MRSVLPSAKLGNRMILPLRSPLCSCGRAAWVRSSGNKALRSNRKQKNQADQSLVGSVTQPYGMNYVKVEAVSLGDRTGGDGRRSAALAATRRAAGRNESS